MFLLPLIILLLHVPTLRQVSWPVDVVPQRENRRDKDSVLSLSLIPVGWYQNRSNLFHSSNQGWIPQKNELL